MKKIYDFHTSRRASLGFLVCAKKCRKSFPWGKMRGKKRKEEKWIKKNGKGKE